MSYLPNWKEEIEENTAGAEPPPSEMHHHTGSAPLRTGSAPPNRKCTPAPEVQLDSECRRNCEHRCPCQPRIGFRRHRGGVLSFRILIVKFFRKKKNTGVSRPPLTKKIPRVVFDLQGSHDIWPVSWSWYIIQGGSVTLDSGVNGGLSLVSRWTRLG